MKNGSAATSVMITFDAKMITFDAKMITFDAKMITFFAEAYGPQKYARYYV